MALGLSSSLSWDHSITRRTPVRISPSRVSAKAFTVVAQKKVKKYCQVVLNEDIPPTGNAGDLCRVRAGYLRNYLLPRGMAQRATSQLLKEMKMEEERIEAEKKRVKEEAQQLALLFETYGPLKVKRTGGKGKLIFGTVTSQDLVDIIKAKLQRDVDKRTVSVPDIRETGSYIVTIKLHPEVTAQVRLIVHAN